MFGVGDILGAGGYALVGDVAGRAGGFAGAAFLVTVSVALPTALSYAALGSWDWVVKRATPNVPEWSFSCIALFAVANTGLLNLVMGSRLLYGIADQGLLPKSLHTVHAKTRTPYLTI